jgi:hypothetical protein
MLPVGLQKNLSNDKYASTGLSWKSSSVAGCQKLVRRDVWRCSSMGTISRDSGRIWGRYEQLLGKTSAMMWSLFIVWSPQGPYIKVMSTDRPWRKYFFAVVSSAILCHRVKQVASIICILLVWKQNHWDPAEPENFTNFLTFAVSLTWYYFYIWIKITVTYRKIWSLKSQVDEFEGYGVLWCYTV